MSNRTSSGKRQIKRRRFIQGAGAALAAFTILKPNQVRGAEANSKVRLGLIGCGNRGIWIADLFRNHGGYEITALTDYFEDKVNDYGNRINVPADKRFTGLSGYKRLLDSGAVDAIAIESPPYFHPEQAAAGVEAGKHVYLAKPIAVDVPGCQTVEASGKKATEKKRCFLVDFQTRTNDLYREAVKRVQFGDIGKILNGEATYICGSTWGGQAEWLAKDPQNSEFRLRGWGLDRALSGDVITEQNIHSIDVATWILDDAPVKAYGTGGRQVRKAGDCWDNFSVIYTFPKDVIITFSSKQEGQGWDDILCRVYGAKGTIDTHYFGSVSILGETPFKGGPMDNLYTKGAESNIATFHENILKGKFENDTVAPSVRSNLTTILGRTAAWKKGEVTWDEMIRAQERLDPRLTGLKS